MVKCKAKFQSGEQAFMAWSERVRTGEADEIYRVGEGDIARFTIAPKRVTLLGGAPGQGKTALAMQTTIDALRLQPGLTALVCNIEMGSDALLDRQLARLSGVDLNIVRGRTFTTEQAERIDAGINTIETVVERLTFVSAPFDLDNIAATADDTNSKVLVLDYIQRIRPPGSHGDKRGSVDATMDYLRKFADQDIAVMVVAAVARTKDRKGRSSYDSAGLGLASFRESSELEYGADDAYLLVPHPHDDGIVVMRHLKARHGETGDIELEFNGSLQRFSSVSSINSGASDAVKDAWARAGQATKKGKK